MELPYQAISDAEAEELWHDLAEVALAQGDGNLYTRIRESYGKKGGGAAAAASRMSDIQGLPDG